MVSSEDRLKLDKAERRWITKKWQEIRAAQMAADAANKDWKRINAEINEKHARENARRMATGQFAKTDLMMSQEKGDSLALQDALRTGNWHARNAERHIHDVNLFLKLKELDLL